MAPPNASSVRFSELRVTQPGTDVDEYVELAGPPGTTLDGLSYVVLGDDVAGSGCVEEIVALDGHRIGSDGLFLIAQPTLNLAIPHRPPDLVIPLNLENHENLTHLLVRGLHASLGADLDLDDDGTLDLTPWSALLDAVATVTEKIPPQPGAEWWYATHVGPKRDGTTPYHVRRDPRDGSWLVGPDDPIHGVDTPGAPNGPGPVVLDAPGDVNGDSVVDALDLWLLEINWGEPYTLADFDGDGIVGSGDLAILLANWS